MDNWFGGGIFSVNYKATAFIHPYAAGLNRYDGYTSRSTSMPRMSRDLYRIITLPILWKCLTDGFG